MFLLREKLEEQARGRRSNRKPAEPVKALLKTCAESAQRTLRILATLQAQDLLGEFTPTILRSRLDLIWFGEIELFLPFDLDHAFSAGFVLCLLSIIDPSALQMQDSYMESTMHILNALVAGGNQPAQFRREELSRLHNMLYLWKQQNSTAQSLAAQGQPPLWITHPGEQGISPDQILNVASLLDCYEPASMEGDPNSWVWDGAHFQELPLSDTLEGHLTEMDNL
jgi:hypothetical protein